MNQVRDFFRLASSPSLALAGAKAPKRWRRELRRWSQSHTDLDRTWIWVTRLDELKVCLRDGPLWGNYLSDLLASSTKSGGAPPNTMGEAGEQLAGLERMNSRNESVERRDRERPRRSDSTTSQIEHPRLPGRRLGHPGPPDSFLEPNYSGEDVTGTLRKRHLVGASSTGLRMMALTALPLTVNHGQLTSALRQPDSVSWRKVNDSGSSQSSRSEEKGFSRRPDHLPLSDGTRTSTHQDLGPPPAPLARRRPGPRIDASAQRGKADWKREMTRRVGRVFRSVRGNSTHDKPNNAPLTQQWTVTLSGPTASMDLLTLFSRSAQPDGDVLEGRYNRSQRLKGNNSPARDSAAAPMIPDAKTAGHAPNRDNKSLTSQPAAQHRSPAVDQSAPEFAVALPPLVAAPPAELGDAAVMAVAREGAEIEALSLDEDFDALADKIKLILDEQARRFGIDV